MSNKEIVKKYFDFFLSGKKEKAFELLHDNIKWIVKGSTNVPTVGIRKGKSEVEEFFKQFEENFEPQEFNIKKYFASGNTVLAIGSFTHFIKPTKKTITSDWMIEFIIQDEKIKSYRILEDSYALYLAFLKE